MLAASGTQVREVYEKNGGEGVLSGSNIDSVSDGRWWGVRARVVPTDSEDEAAAFLASAGESEILNGLEGWVGERECA